MTRQQLKYKRKSVVNRKNALIDATLSLIASKGIKGATVRAIAQHANVTQGLIRYYFNTKEQLITAAYRHHMGRLTQVTFAPLNSMPEEGPATRLATFVASGLVPPVVDPGSLSVWASFINKVQNDKTMRETHRETYFEFRDCLEMLIREALVEAGKPASEEGLRQLAIATNAVIDGLWLEGGALPDAFERGELAVIGVRSVSAIIGIDLPEGKSDK